MLPLTAFDMRLSKLAIFKFALFHAVAMAATGFVSLDQAHEVRAIYRLGGQPTGTYHELETVDDKGDATTTIDTVIVFNRLGSKLEIKGGTRYREDPEGRILGFVSDQSSSQQTMRATGEVSDGSVSVTTESGGKKYERKLAFTGVLIGPEGARRLVLKSLQKVGDIVAYQTFSPELGVVATYTDKLVAIGSFEISKHVETGLKIEQSLSAMPGKSVVVLDKSGWLLSQSTPSPFGDIVASRTDAEGMKSGAEGATLPSETFTKSIITSNVRLPDERLIESIKIKLILKNRDLGWPNFSAPNQRVVSQTREVTILQIKRPQVNTRTSRPESVDSSMQGCLKPNALLQSDDPAVKSIVARVVNPTDDSWAAVRALQKWTNDNMHFDLGIAIAPASEVAKNRGGTCFGYSMLLGSLARAAGVPSRVRMGLVYAGGIWGGHAWVDVLIGKDWIPIDGALYSPGPADAARVSCFTSSLEESTVSNVGSLARLFGNVDIKILEFTVSGKRTVVSPGAPPYSIVGDTYRNPWLGVTLRKPAGFHFTKFNVVWPQTTVVAMEDSDGRQIEVQNLSASLPTGTAKAAEPKEPGKAELRLERRGSQWLVVASGRDAKRLLRRFASSIVLDR